MASGRMVSGSSRMRATLSWVLGGCYWRATSEWGIVRQLVQAATRCLPTPVLALTAQTPHGASIMARNRGAGPPRCSKRRGRLVAPGSVARPARNRQDPNGGRKRGPMPRALGLTLRATGSR